MLLDIIINVAADSGLHPVQQRETLVNIINRAAKELHHQLECNNILREISLVVPPDKVIALPAYVGEVRGLRIHMTETPFDLQSLAVPRYKNSTLRYRIRCWRDLGFSAISMNPSVIAPLGIAVPSPDPDSTLIIVGQTNHAERVEERIPLTDTNLLTANAFGPKIYTIACFNPREQDIQILDDNGNEIAILYNDQKNTRYKIIDVSQVFWPITDTIDGNSVIDVLYKLPFRPLKNDTDSFSAGDDYDNAIYYLAMYVYLLPIAGKEQDAQMNLKQAYISLKGVQTGEEEGIEKKLNFGRGKFLDLFKHGRRSPVNDQYGYPYNFPWGGNTY